MDSYQPQQEHNGLNVPPPLINPPPHVFGGDDLLGSPTDPYFAAPYFADDQGGSLEESNDAKRRRIARVCVSHLQCCNQSVDNTTAGL